MFNYKGNNGLVKTLFIVNTKLQETKQILTDIKTRLIIVKEVLQHPPIIPRLVYSADNPRIDPNIIVIDDSDDEDNNVSVGPRLNPANINNILQDAEKRMLLLENDISRIQQLIDDISATIPQQPNENTGGNTGTNVALNVVNAGASTSQGVANESKEGFKIRVRPMKKLLRADVLRFED